ncbi:hypothetical protein [Microbacterium sp. NPDC058389]|uniref:hypothetical protein n=1 Tax=Microbacterium sp. NPDC058389 TaxID=3346475 RepID=UPI0036498F9C
MASEALEIPVVEDLIELGLEVDRHEEPWVVTATAWAADGSGVALTWDESARSVAVRWFDDAGDRARLERETATKVSVRKQDDGTIEFRVWMRSADLDGELLIQVGRRVTLSDALLVTR